MKVLLAFALAITGCATSFTGDAHIEPAACQAKCQAANLQMVGMVYMGEYSSACLCEVPRAPAPPQGAPGAVSTLMFGAGGTGGAAAGVVMQMRRQAEQRNQHRY